GSECSRSKASHLRFGPPEIEIWNVSLTPGSPSSVTSTVKVRGRPSLIHVPPKVAVAPAIESQSNLAPCTQAPLTWLTYCRSPWIERRLSSVTRRVIAGPRLASISTVPEKANTGERARAGSREID